MQGLPATRGPSFLTRSYDVLSAVRVDRRVCSNFCSASVGAHAAPARNAMRGDDPPSCALPYDNGRWTAATTAAARGCIMESLQRDLTWWRTESCHGSPEPPISHVPDIEATLCRVRAQHPHTVLTNMMLLQSRGGNLSALFMVDPGDERGPSRHWPGRPIAAIQQLAELQQKVQEGALPPLPDFVAILNPHDQPKQMAPNGWCGLLPILSNSRTAGAHRDLLMPDYSFLLRVHHVSDELAEQYEPEQCPATRLARRTSFGVPSGHPGGVG